MSFWKKIERLGYLRAAGEMKRNGYPDLAAEMEKQARNLK